MVSKSFDINTASLSPFEPNNRRLLLELSPTAVSVILWNKETHLPEAFEVFNGAFTGEADWQTMIGQSRLLGLNHLETQVIHCYEAMLPIPLELYTPELAKDQLQLFYGEKWGMHTGADIIESRQMALAWQIPIELFQLITSHFQVVQLRHVGSCMVQECEKDGSPNGHLVVYGHLGWVALWGSDGLLIMKSIAIAQPDDLSWHLLNICRHFNVEPLEISWRVSGMAEENSALWNAVTRFFEPVIAMPAGVDLPEDLPGHYFAHLFPLAKS